MTTLDISGLEKRLESLHLPVPLPTLDTADVLTKPLDLCRIYLADALSSLVECSPEAAYKSIQWPNNIYMGDLAVILPKLCPGSKAVEVANDLLKKFPRDHPLFPLPFLETVHFRIFLEAKPLARLLLPFILDRKSTYGNDAALGLRNPSSPEEGRKKLIVEFSSPNITSEFQGKHLRSTILGAFVSKFHENMGWDVTRINYLGDWGKDIALLKVGWERFGNEAEYEANAIRHLLDVYHQIHELFRPERVASKLARDEAAKHGHDEGEVQLEIENQGIFAERNAAFKKLQDGDEEAIAFWKRVRDVNIESYKDFNSQLGVMFDEYTGESQVSPDTMAEIEQMLKDKGICKEGAGAWVVHMQEIGLKAGTAIIRDRIGATTYLLRDLAAVLERSRKYEFDKMIIVAANDNGVHFTHLHHILKALDMAELADKVQHLRFSEVSRMAEKLEKWYRPQAIISHCEEAMAAALEADGEKSAIFKGSVESAKVLGVSALLAQELSTRTGAAHSFDISTMTAFKPGTGPDMQYWYTKLCSILKGNPAHSELSDEDYELFMKEEPANLLRLLAQYPEVTHATYQSLEPAAIVTYLASVIEQLGECLKRYEEDEANVLPPGGDVDAEAVKLDGDADAEVIAPEGEATTKAVEPEAEPVAKAVEPDGEGEPVAEAVEPKGEADVEAVKPEPAAEAIEPELAAEAVEPEGEGEAVGEAVEPEPAAEAVEPEGEGEPVAEAVELKGEADVEAVKPEPAAEAVEPELAAEAVEPEGEGEAVGEAVEPEPAAEAVEPGEGEGDAEAVKLEGDAGAEAIAPEGEATAEAVEPEPAAEAVEPGEGEVDAEAVKLDGDADAEVIAPEGEATTEAVEPEAEPVAEAVEPDGEGEPVAEAVEPKGEADAEAVKPHGDADAEAVKPEGDAEAMAVEPEGEAAAEPAKPEGEPEVQVAEPEKKDITFAPGHLVLFEATRVVLENGMKLLGITPYATTEPERADTPIAE